MTENQIECAVSRKIDALDRRFMTGKYTQEQYDALMREIHNWADKEYIASNFGKSLLCR